MSQLYRKFTSTVLVPNLSLVEDVNVINQNQNINVIDFDITLASTVLTLPSLTSLFGLNGTGGGATTFRIQGNILAGAFPRTLTLAAYNTEGDADDICGDTTVTLSGVAVCFELIIVGRHRWMLSACSPATFS